MRRLAIPLLMHLPVVCLAVAAPTQAQVSSDEDQIRRARAESNQAIAEHDVPGIVAFLEDDYQVSVSSGAFLTGPDEMGDASDAHFAEFEDATYVRTPESVEVSSASPVAAERGSWVGSWTTPDGPFHTGGRYMAYWRRTGGQWRIHSELFVPLFCDGPGCG